MRPPDPTRVFVREVLERVLRQRIRRGGRFAGACLLDSGNPGTLVLRVPMPGGRVDEVEIDTRIRRR